MLIKTNLSLLDSYYFLKKKNNYMLIKFIYYSHLSNDLFTKKICYFSQ